MEEGRPTDIQLISNAAQRPDIDFVVIRRLRKYFRGGVVEGADVLQSALEASTAKIPQLISVLTTLKSTCETKMFSGLISRCIMPFSWRYATAVVISYSILRILLILEIWEVKVSLFLVHVAFCSDMFFRTWCFSSWPRVSL